MHYTKTLMKVFVRLRTCAIDKDHGSVKCHMFGPMFYVSGESIEPYKEIEMKGRQTLMRVVTVGKEAVTREQRA